MGNMPETTRLRVAPDLAGQVATCRRQRAGGMVTVVDDARRLVPRTDAILADPRLAAAERRLGRPLVREAVRRAQQRARAGEIGPDEVAAAAVTGLPPLAASLTPVLNATGVLLHTNLGRAPLSAAARDAVAAAAGWTDLEFDLARGARGRRGAAMLAALARAVPDAQAVHVVNNNAAALVLDRDRAGRGPGDRGQPGRADRDRRRLQAARAAGQHRRDDPGGRQHEPDVRRRLRGRGRAADRFRAQGPSVELPDRRVHGQRGDRRAGRARRAPGRRHRLRAARAASGAARRAGRGDLAAGGRRPGHRQRRQAARRSAGRAAARPRRPGQAAGQAPAGQGTAGRQADGGGARGHAGRPDAARAASALRRSAGADPPGRTARRRCSPRLDSMPGRWPVRPPSGAAAPPA